MKFLIYLVVLFFFFNGFKANNVGDSLIQDACKKASRLEGQTYYKFCITSIKENPESQRVRNIDELIVVGVKNAMKSMRNVNGIVERILKERKYKNKLSEKLLRDCLKQYSEGSGLLTKALEYIKSRDYQKVDDNMRDAKAVPRLCEMGFNGDNNQTSPVKKENDVLFELLDIAHVFNSEFHINPSPSV